MKRHLLITVLLTVLTLTASAFAGFGGSPFQPSWDLDPILIKPGDDATLTVTLRMPPNHFVYQDKTSLDFMSLEGILVQKVTYPKSVLHEDPVTGQAAQVYMGEVPITAKIHVPASAEPADHDLIATLSYQGCSEKLCLRPEETQIQWTVRVVAATGATPDDTPAMTGEAPVPQEKVAEAPVFQLPTSADELVQRGLLWAFLAAFIGGLLTSFTPCVLPLLPITLMVIGVGQHRKHHHNFALAVMLTLGMTVTYALLGSLAAILGLQLGFLFQQKWFLALVILFFVFMSLSMFDIITLQMPMWLRNLLLKLGGKGPLGAFLAGISMGFLAAPCVGPVMGALLAFVGLTKDVWTGFLLMCSFALGMGTLFIVVGTFYGSLSHHTRKPHIAVWVKRVLGILLLLPALYYFDSFVPWIDRVPFLQQEGVVWITDEATVLSRAKAVNEPILVDFSAKWCAPCLEMDRTTFHNPDVVAKLSAHWVTWRVDATTMTPELKKLLDRFNVVGWPTVLFLNPDGTEIPKSRRVGEVISPEKMLSILGKLEQPYVVPAQPSDH